MFIYLAAVSKKILLTETLMQPLMKLSKAKKANIHDFIMTLPNGYDTFVENVVQDYPVVRSKESLLQESS